jgi:asparagine synthase (glutamine-hydrolysing)
VLRERPKAAGMLEFSGSWPGVYLLRRALYLPHELPALIGPELAREGLRRLDLFDRIGASLAPDPGSDVGRVCALESCNYMRGQLLRDADWAGMAHGVEIRTPLADIELLRALAPCLPRLRPGEGKAALAAAPSIALPAKVVSREKTGFIMPMGDWMADGSDRERRLKGLASRHWARRVYAAAVPAPSLATAA